PVKKSGVRDRCRKAAPVLAAEQAPILDQPVRAARFGRHAEPVRPQLVDAQAGSGECIHPLREPGAFDDEEVAALIGVPREQGDMQGINVSRETLLECIGCGLQDAFRVSSRHRRAGGKDAFTGEQDDDAAVGGKCGGFVQLALLRKAGAIAIAVQHQPRRVRVFRGSIAADPDDQFFHYQVPRLRLAVRTTPVRESRCNTLYIVTRDEPMTASTPTRNQFDCTPKTLSGNGDWMTDCASARFSNPAWLRNSTSRAASCAVSSSASATSSSGGAVLTLTVVTPASAGSAVT